MCNSHKLGCASFKYNCDSCLIKFDYESLMCNNQVNLQIKGAENDFESIKRALLSLTSVSNPYIKKMQ